MNDSTHQQELTSDSTIILETRYAFRFYANSRVGHYRCTLATHIRRAPPIAWVRMNDQEGELLFMVTPRTSHMRAAAVTNGAAVTIRDRYTSAIFRRQLKVVRL